MLGGDDAQVVDPGRRRRGGGGLRFRLGMAVTPDLLRAGKAVGLAVPPDLDDGQIERVLWPAARYWESWWSGVTELGLLPYLGCIIALVKEQ